MSEKVGVPVGSIRRLYKLLESVFSGYEAVEETEGGYLLTFPAGGGWRKRLEAFRAEFQARFPAYELELVEQSDGRFTLEFIGGEGAREYIERLIATGQRDGFKLPSIAEHPRTRTAIQKELGFFDVAYSRGLKSYRSMFPLGFRSGPGTQTFEATPTYLAYPEAHERVRRALPDAKLVVMVRNPVERAFSQYHWGVRSQMENLSFPEAIEREPERLAGEAERVAKDESYVSPGWIYHSYAASGRYAEHLERWLSVFPREQLLVVGMEAFAADSPGQFARILEFLELDPFEPKEYAKINAYPYPGIDPATRKRLQDEFRPYNERLWELLGEDLGWNDENR
jgi:hypothetical protein